MNAFVWIPLGILAWIAAFNASLLTAAVIAGVLAGVRETRKKPQ